jgi:hypothetical protein
MSSILPLGTRVVTSSEIAVPENGMSLPAGAVAEIIRSPGDPAGVYRIRFPDGAEATARREELTILRTMQRDRLRGGSDTGIDWMSFVALRVVVGSRAFGLDVEGSDYDRRGFYIAPADLHWSLPGVPEQLENEATQETYWEIEKFLRLALKANANVLECLWSPMIEEASDVARELLGMRDAFLSKLAYQTYNGYVISQFKKLEQDFRRGEIRWKHAMHLIRLLLSGITLLRDRYVLVQVDDHRERLLAIRRGELPWEEIESWRHELHRQFDDAFRTTSLPEQADFDRVNAFLIRARRSMT